MTLPSVVNHYQAVVLKTQFEKQYSIITNVIQKMNYDFGGLNTMQFEHGKFMTEFKKYLNIIKDCGQRGCDNSGTAPEEGLEFVSINYKTYNNKNMSTGLLDDGQAIITDGSLYLIENYGSASKYQLYISVDVNGIKKRPNRWGHDLFTFQVFDNGKVLPMGAPNTYYRSHKDYCSLTSNSTYNGISCAHKASTEKDYFKNLPK